jgi:acetylornithine/succinyldiaminopimelate/putrescine aminotransferase
MEWAQENADITASLGIRFESGLRDLATDFPDLITGIDGWRHMTTLGFADTNRAKAFVGALADRGLDVSVQAYKADTPPVALTKLPLTADQAVVDYIIAAMREALEELS